MLNVAILSVHLLAVHGCGGAFVCVRVFELENCHLVNDLFVCCGLDAQVITY